MPDVLKLLAMPARIVWWLAKATANSALVLLKLKYKPPTGDPVWRGDLRDL